ncbi:MAG: CehA/McbA family metallohydrolase, partial [Myxococcales bacterium]
GPFYTLARQTLKVETAAQEVRLTLEKLPLQPADSVSADLHVHGRASFDSSIPDGDRVLSFAAANVDVIAATDHDVIGDYAESLKLLNLEKRVAVMVGLETTGHIPWFTNPGSSVPRVIGHYNFWPLKIDYSKPRRGAPWDELIEPGTLFTRVDPIFDGSGVIELNHPWADLEFGRDLGYPRALGMNCKEPLPMKDDGTAAGRFFRTPEGSLYANNAHHAQEVMNGSRNDSHLQYRAVWFCFLNQGIVRAGTANSDSHSLTDNVLGTPRNVVFAKTSAASFDAELFNEAVRKGRLVGTNGPMIEAVVRSGAREVRPSVDPLPAPAEGDQLLIKVRAAPWVSVKQVRIIVNGEVKRTFEDLERPADPFGRGGLDRFERAVPLAELLPAGNRDAWIVVEAGEPLPLAGDLDDNGIPDTSDNDGDGKVDQADVKEGSKTGPIVPPPVPTDEADANYHFGVVHHGGVPQAFTNPFIFDRDGGGFTGPGVNGGSK